MKDAQAKLGSLGMKPRGSPAWWSKPYDLSSKDKRAIAESHGDDGGDGDGDDGQSGDESGDTEGDGSAGDGTGTTGTGSADSDETAGESEGDDDGDGEAAVDAVVKVVEPSSKKEMWVQAVVSNFNKEMTMIKLSASRKQRYLESDRPQPGPLSGVPVPDGGNEVMKLCSDVAVWFEGEGWRLGTVEQIFKKHQRGTTQWHNPVEIGEGKRPQGVFVTCTWFELKQGSRTIFTNDNFRDLNEVPLESVSTVLKMLHDKATGEFEFAASDRVWLDANEPE